MDLIWVMAFLLCSTMIKVAEQWPMVAGLACLPNRWSYLWGLRYHCRCHRFRLPVTRTQSLLSWIFCFCLLCVSSIFLLILYLCSTSASLRSECSSLPCLTCLICPLHGSPDCSPSPRQPAHPFPILRLSPTNFQHPQQCSPPWSYSEALHSLHFN